jgi:hypothetical protein
MAMMALWRYFYLCFGVGTSKTTPYTRRHGYFSWGTRRRVKDQDYYHINRLVDWSPHRNPLSVGEAIDVGGSSNPYFRLFETVGATYPLVQGGQVTQRIPGVRFLELVRDGVINPSNLARDAFDLASYLARHIGEFVFEDVRRREFPHLPSRQRCVWLIPNQDGARYWVRRLGMVEEGVDFQVVRVRVQGRLHTASESYLVTDSMPLLEVITRARQYWLGIVEEAGTEEIIFEGRMRVEEVMPESFYAQQDTPGAP